MRQNNYRRGFPNHMPTFYEIDSVGANLTELWWTCHRKPLGFVVALLAKLLRSRVPFSSDDPNVDSTLECIYEELPAEISDHFRPLADELRELGFQDPVYHYINDDGTGTTLYWATYRHSSGEHCARIHNRYWARAAKRERALFTIIFTPFSDGTFLLSSAGTPDTPAPRSVKMNRMPGVKPSSLWLAHQKLATRENKSITAVRNQAEVIQACENLHVSQRDYHLASGFFRQRHPDETAKAAEFTAKVDDLRTQGSSHPEVLAEIARLEEQKPRWSQAIWPLVLSGIAFLVVGAARWKWETVLWLIPILLFHEFGHWVAMRVFGYRDLRMFFIPFFGAAVTGRNRTIEGWKKALVYLAGPLPGIALGSALGVAAMITGMEWERKAAMLMILINAFNLLPVLPMDGGRFMHITLFSRNRWLDGGFRILAVVALVGLTVAHLGRLTVFIAISLAVGIPAAFKIGKVVDHFRRNPLPPALPGEERIPQTKAETLITAIKAELPVASNKTVANVVLNIYETLNARPPGIAATLGLFSLYGGAIAVSVLFFFVTVIGGMGDFFHASMDQPKIRLEPAVCEVWRGNGAPAAAAGHRDFVAVTLRNHADAQAAYRSSTNSLPANATAILLGNSVMVSLPGTNSVTVKEWFDRFHGESTNTTVFTNGGISIAFSFLATNRVAATNLETLLGGYFGVHEINLIPPWDPIVESPSFAPQLEARRVWWRMDTQFLKTVADGSVKSWSAAVAAGKNGDTNATVRMIEESNRRIWNQAFDQLAAEYASTPYADLVTWKRQLFEVQQTNEAQRATAAAIGAKIGERLGRAAGPANGELKPSGFVSRHSLLFLIPEFGIPDPETTLPQFLDWLRRKGCKNFHYQLVENSDDSDI